jgi:SAM-dependent methyltransferase
MFLENAEANVLTGSRDKSDETAFVNERSKPKPGQPKYLVCSDFLPVMDAVRTNEELRILDYGAYLSPYRAYFPNSDYRCADIGGPGAKDYLIGEDGKVSEQDEFFDLVLSTDVAEHVPDPENYFAECYRLLKPGGRLFLTTVGAYEEHDHPGDFRRWTAEGLRYDLTKAGFEIVSGWKSTTGPRAALHHLERSLELTLLSRKTISGMASWMLRIAYRKARPVTHRIADWLFANYRLVSDQTTNSAHNMYIGLALMARRPDHVKPE